MRRVLILRPEPGASATLERAHALGLTPSVHPLFAIEPVDWTMPEGTFDGLLLTSANAVRRAGALPALPTYAVGEATAEAAREAGASVVHVGTGGVDDLLASLPAKLRLLHLTGQTRTELSVRGPEITPVPVYRAVPLEPPSQHFFRDAVLMVHSPAAGRRVVAIVRDKTASRIAAISPAAVDACGSGWERIEAAQLPSDRALLSLALKLCKD